LAIVFVQICKDQVHQEVGGCDCGLRVLED
jgi:hypothetical protein